MREVSPCQERFFFSTTVTATGGFGIGLSIARSIAEGHRGSIKAKSDRICCGAQTDDKMRYSERNPKFVFVAVDNAVYI